MMMMMVVVGFDVLLDYNHFVRFFSHVFDSSDGHIYWTAIESNKRIKNKKIEWKLLPIQFSIIVDLSLSLSLSSDRRSIKINTLCEMVRPFSWKFIIASEIWICIGLTICSILNEVFNRLASREISKRNLFHSRLRWVRQERQHRSIVWTQLLWQIGFVPLLAPIDDLDCACEYGLCWWWWLWFEW